jgi:hypothetical protein
MRLEAQGAVVYEGRQEVAPQRLQDLSRALGSGSAGETATLVPFFGPTVADMDAFVDVLGLDLDRALLGGLGYDWRRPFRPAEVVDVSVTIESVVEKGSNRIGVVVAEFRGSDGEVIQRQSATFIERSSS